MKHLLGLALLLLPVSSALAEEPKGEIITLRSSASFDDTWVYGPHISVSRREDGRSWAGRIRGHIVDFDVTPDHLVGVGTNLTVHHEDGWLILDGTFDYSPVHVYWPKDTSWQRWYFFKLKGEAARADPPMPQFLLALLGAL